MKHHAIHWLKALTLMLLLIAGGACKNDPPQPSAATEPSLPSLEEDYEPSPVKWGYINTLGDWVISPQYDDCRNFKEELAVVRIGGRWGFINLKGKLIIPASFQAAWDFSEGLARVKVFNQGMGFINTKGQFAIQPIWEAASDFSGEMARIQCGELFGYINSMGDVVIPCQFVRAENFKNGRALVQKPAMGYDRPGWAMAYCSRV
ncbi:MAG: WG repeat-containing protein [Saprospirales bacterium]|nr:WG repeat-containing protein [Saprospirales bacterium]